MKEEAEKEVDTGSQSTQDILLDRLMMLTYRDSGLGQSAFNDDFSSCSIDSVNAFRTKNYVGSRMVVGAAGNVDHEQFVKEAENHFGSIRKGSKPTVE